MRNKKKAAKKTFVRKKLMKLTKEANHISAVLMHGRGRLQSKVPDFLGPLKITKSIFLEGMSESTSVHKNTFLV